jgi:hypothetical protein
MNGTMGMKTQGITKIKAHNISSLIGVNSSS